MVASYAEVPAEDCETIQASDEELDTFSSRGFQTQNSERMLGDRKLDNALAEVRSMREELRKKK